MCLPSQAILSSRHDFSDRFFAKLIIDELEGRRVVCLPSLPQLFPRIFGNCLPGGIEMNGTAEYKNVFEDLPLLVEDKATYEGAFPRGGSPSE